MAMRARVCSLLIALAASGCAEELFVASETRELFAGAAPVTFEESCGLAFEDGPFLGSGFGVAPSDGSASFSDEVSIERIVVGDELQVRVRNAGVTLAAKGYGRGFLESGRLDSFTVTTRGGRQFELLHQGGPDCESIDLFLH
jgi:hypothetical protein